MRITLYNSSLCPRCHLAGKWLNRAAQVYPEIEIDAVDILAAPGRAWRDGIRMIPALKAGDRQLSGLYLSERDIATFLAEIIEAQRNSTPPTCCEKNPL